MALVVCATALAGTLLIVQKVHTSVTAAAEALTARNIARETLIAVVDNSCANLGDASGARVCQAEMPAAPRGLGNSRAKLTRGGVPFVLEVNVTASGVCADKPTVTSANVIQKVAVSVTGPRAVVDVSEHLGYTGNVLAVPGKPGESETVTYGEDGTATVATVNAQGCAIFPVELAGTYRTGSNDLLTVGNGA